MDVPENAMSDSTQTTNQTATPAPLQTPFSVLFVDDDEMSRNHFARAVRDDYRVHLARDADEAMALLHDLGPEIAVLVTDFRMPGRDGGHLLREVGETYPQIVRILVTAYADKDMLLQTFNTGDLFRILEKPLRVESVREVLRQAVTRYAERETRQQRLLAMDETLAFLAHELNTPLAAISLFARSVENDVAQDYDPERQREIGLAATSMLNNAQYCLTLISSFWATVHKSGGPQPASGSAAREVKATRLIATLLDSYPFAGAQREWVAVDARGDFVIHAMPNCVALVLSSLISNALRALDGCPAPSLRVEVVSEPEPEIRLHDNGPGIEPEVKARLLLDPVTTHAGRGGHGMGMIFCNRIMQSFGGGLRIESAVGEGTTVTMRFPGIRGRVQSGVGEARDSGAI
ncbi:response regulator receiver sensor signal transduction histidine kinase [Paraburkholderia sp. GV068]|jgi:signal transduction histidine kinase|uniref:histidine kinase n=2 Tax=Burkholderiaceae TaxID=119060 RepID=B1G7A2_PARG4|nr:response regulator receiver sensor signal transduction histidine kinase [Paraburkholderia graminis C4D1M]PTR04367.1 response regulator receiver sensor signal transduction histidine kinase [Paraburkholderia sp. GV072]PUB09324.1 response regulator receiver sensor signal transduction histidine kinase [Paraburkholderia sp. GV068]CAB3642570.1 Adaptive-response sensory-kinase SasA [Paraburkholderia graminis C4D1M]